MPQLPIGSRTGRYLAIFTSGFVLGAAMMASPATGLALMLAGIGFLIFWLKRNT